jgi:tRNA (mo5U34)-methyltransferase
LAGYQQNLNAIKFVDQLTDADLRALNNFLPWNCFTVDINGRRFGNAAWANKRSEAEVIPDRRVLLINDRFDLSDKHVLEIGCFEGIHTIGLSKFSKKITAVDARIENVVKTLIRCAFFGCQPTVFKCNVEERPLPIGLLSADLGYHVGVLYHLRDPVQHLLDLGSFIRRGLLLDTHYALEHEVKRAYEVNGRVYHFMQYREAGYEEVFAGIYDHAKWLTLVDIVELLRMAGFQNVDIVETRRERNGMRALLIAERGSNCTASSNGF